MVQGALEWKNNGKQCSLTSVSACVCVCVRAIIGLFWLCMMQSFGCADCRFCAVCVAAPPVAVPVPVANLGSATGVAAGRRHGVASTTLRQSVQ